MSIIDKFLKGEQMGGKANSTKKTSTSEEIVEEVNTDTNAEQTTPEESGSTSGETKPEQVNNSFAEMYDMLTERDNAIKQLTNEVAALKKENTNLLLKVNASAQAGDKIKNPYEKFVDSMVQR